MINPIKSNLEGLLPSWAKYLVACGATAPSADNCQPWHFLWRGNALELGLSEARSGGGLGHDHPATGMALGAVIENIIQAAAHMNLPSNSIEILPDQGTEKLYLHIDPRDESALLAPPEELPLERRHTNRGRFSKESLDSVLLREISEFTDGNARTLVFEDRNEIAEIARFIKRASQARFQNEEIHSSLASSLRFTEKEAQAGDGLDVNTLALPPGGKSLLKLVADWRRMSFLNTFGAYKLFASMEASSILDCGAIVAVIGDWNNLPGVISCGRVMERCWIAFNEAGYGVHPYFVLSDQLYRLHKGLVPGALIRHIEQLSHEIVSFFALDHNSLAMLFRVGKPINPHIGSRRLPLDEVVTVLG